MDANVLIAVTYGTFLLIILIINFLYFFQVFKYRLPGDASVSVLAIHISLLLIFLFLGSFFIRF